MKYILLAGLVWGFLSSCNQKDQRDTQWEGSIKISVDETFQPVMEEQLKVFKARTPKANIVVQYKPEADCLKDFMEDTTRVIFITRELSSEEKEYCLSKKIVPSSMSMAKDGIAFIVSKENPNKNFSEKQIRDVLTGHSANDLQVVFDNQHSSTVRYVMDSILKGEKMSGNIFAAKGSEDVIDYISKNKKAIGVIGVSWISDQDGDENAQNFLKQIDVCGILKQGGTKYVKPYQAYLGLKDTMGRTEYPFTWDLYFISKETWVGLGSGLVNYLCKDGQVLFKKAKLFPTRSNVYIKQTVIKNEIEND